MKAGEPKKKITIVGCGIAGGYLAIMLANRGYTVEIFEQLSKKAICDSNSKRSYNITLLAYGIEMLKRAKIWEIVKPHLLPLQGSSTQLSKDSKPIISPVYNKKKQYYAVSRSTLLDIMLEQIKNDPLITIHYETALLSIDRHERTIIVQNTKTQKIKTLPCDVIIGADGANSLVRSFMQQGQHTHHTQEYATGGYKQFTITKKQVDQLNLKSDIAYTWSADKKFILAFPNFDGSLASLLIFPKDRKEFVSLQSASSITKLIRNDFPLLQPIENEIAEQLLQNPDGTFVTIHTDPWYYKDFITVIGDAAHGFYPFFGQGTSAAFGDCLALCNLLDSNGDKWGKIFPRYQEARKRHMDSLGELSKKALMRYQRNKRADYDSIYDKLEHVAHSLSPKRIQPPVFIPVMEDPKNTDDYVIRAHKQRALAKWFGIPLAVTVLTGIVALYERLPKGKN